MWSGSPRNAQLGQLRCALCRRVSQRVSSFLFLTPALNPKPRGTSSHTRPRGRPPGVGVGDPAAPLQPAGPLPRPRPPWSPRSPAPTAGGKAGSRPSQTALILNPDPELPA